MTTASPAAPRWARVALPLLFVVYAVLAAVAAWTKSGDFTGYLVMGDAVINGTDAYANPKLNTWPPFFSVVAVPLAAAARIWLEGTRLLWILGSVALWWWSAREVATALYGRGTRLVNPAVLLPVLFSTRLFIENIDAIQINVYVLALCLLAVRCWRAGRDGWAGFALGVAVSVKVFPVFAWGLFVARGHWRVASATVVTCLACALVPFLAFGTETALGYYAVWGRQAFGSAVAAGHMNQSLLATLTRFLSAADAGEASRPLGEGYFVNAAALSATAVARLFYGAVAATGAAVVYAFGGRLGRGRTLADWLELGLVLGLCALVSPLVWKHYGVFWLPGLMVAYPFLYASPLSPGGPPLSGRRALRPARWVYHLSWGAMTFSSELFVGRYFSDVLEAYGVMAFGGLLLAGLLGWLRVRVGAAAGTAAG